MPSVASAIRYALTSLSGLSALPAYFTLAKIGQAQGNYEKVTAALNQADRLIRRVQVAPMLAQLKAFMTRLQLRRNNVGAAVR